MFFDIEKQIENSPELKAKIKDHLGSFKIAPFKSLFNLIILTDKGEYGIMLVGQHEIAIYYNENEGYLRRAVAWRFPDSPELDLKIIIDTLMKIEEGNVP
jgi:hypothetical protein